MKEVKIEKCQYCGGEEFIEGEEGSYGSVVVSTGGFHQQVLFAVVCRDCGSVVRTFCKNPEKLYPKNERRD